MNCFSGRDAREKHERLTQLIQMMHSRWLHCCWSCNVNLNAALAATPTLSWNNINEKLTAQYSVGWGSRASSSIHTRRRSTAHNRRETHKKHKFISFLIKMIFIVIKLMTIGQDRYEPTSFVCPPESQEHTNMRVICTHSNAFHIPPHSTKLISLKVEFKVPMSTQFNHIQTIMERRSVIIMWCNER